MKILKASRFLTVLAGIALAAAQQTPKPAPKLSAPSAPPEIKPDTPAEVPPDKIVLTIGNEKLTRADFDQILAALAENGRQASTPPQRRQIAEQLIGLKAVAAEARKRKLDQEGPVHQMMAIQADNVLVSAFAKKLNEDLNPDDAALHSYYDQHKSEYEEAKASHILIRFQGSRVPLKPEQKDLTKEEALAKAQEIRKKLLAGGDFAATAKAESDDAGSGANGGSLGTFSHGQMVPAFDQAAFSLPVGQISEPVESPFGYHLIKVESRTTKSFEEAKADIEKRIKPQLIRDTMERLKAQTPSTLDESYFGKP